jgi:two-component system CheB/CheR fusion protein
MLRRFAPVSVVVNDKGDIVFVHGHTGAYLEPSEGEPRNNVLDMTREGLQIEVSSAIGSAQGPVATSHATTSA